MESHASVQILRKLLTPLSIYLHYYGMDWMGFSGFCLLGWLVGWVTWVVGWLVGGRDFLFVGIISDLQPRMLACVNLCRLFGRTYKRSVVLTRVLVVLSVHTKSH